MRTRTSFWRATAIVGALAFSVSQPAQAGLFDVSADKERKLGDQASRDIGAGAKIVTGPVADWVQGVGARLVAHAKPDFQYSFHVIDSPEINAFALPGGHIFIFTGIRKVVKTDDQLAAVLSHEITHSEEHHYARQYSKSAKRGALLGVLTAVIGVPYAAAQAIGIADLATTQRYSRVLESDADKRGLMRMARAGFNPQGMAELLANLDKEGRDAGGLNKLFADHPSTRKRLREVQALMPEAKALMPRTVAATPTNTK